MDIKQMKVADLVPYMRNAKKHDKAQIDNVAKSIQEFGIVQPIVVDKDNNIIIGHCRALACKQLNLEEVPVVKLEDLTPEDANKLRLLDNKLNESDWDFDLLAEDIPTLDFTEYELDWELPEIETDENEQAEIQEDTPPEEVETRCKLGDIWKLGEHRLICGDSTDVGIIDALMDGVKADMVFTDPPYGMHLDTDWSGAKSNLKFYKEKGCQGQGNKYNKIIGDNDDFNNNLISTIFDNFGYCKEIFVWGADYYPELLVDYKKGSMFVWDKRSNDDTKDEFVEQSDKMYGSQFELCWSKSKHRKQIARIKWAGIFGTEKEFDKKRVHPTQKPISLALWFLEKYSRDLQTVVDLYGGSGSTMIACEQLNRKCYMCELDEHYCDVIIQRWENFTGRKAELINE